MFTYSKAMELPLAAGGRGLQFPNVTQHVANPRTAAYHVGADISACGIGRMAPVTILSEAPQQNYIFSLLLGRRISLVFNFSIKVYIILDALLYR